MIRGLENELKGVEVSKITVAIPTDNTFKQPEVITITEEEITATLPEINLAPTTITIESEKETSFSHEELTDKPLETVKEESFQEEKNIQQEENIPKAVEENPYQKIFDTLIKKIYDRDYDLGACFERNIEFESFNEYKLTWNSTADGEDKKLLITHWGVINMFVKESFGFETKIINIPKKKIVETNHTSQTNISDDLTNTLTTTSPTKEDSIEEEIETKSSCIAPEAGDTEAAKEKDPSTLLQEPMVKEAIALFDPKKVRIKRNS
jgi:DNA polymerase-3 subunit gamma/tau